MVDSLHDGCIINYGANQWWTEYTGYTYSYTGCPNVLSGWFTGIENWSWTTNPSASDDNSGDRTTTSGASDDNSCDWTKSRLQ